MNVGQNIYYITFQGDLYVYEIIDITEAHVIVAWTERKEVLTVFKREEAERLIKKYDTLEKAQEQANKRRNAILYGI